MYEAHHRWVAILGLLALFVAAPPACKDDGSDVTGMAAGVGAKRHVQNVWKQLGQYEQGYLKSWRGAFADPNPPAGDVLDAFNEVAVATTGPTGFWRDKVPNRWFGCEGEQRSAVCKTFDRASKTEFARWDALQQAISNLEPGQEKAFLRKNAKAMATYLDTYVPDTHSASAMKRTPFYSSHLKKAIQAAERSAPVASDGDL